MMMLQPTRAARWLSHWGAISALAGLHLAGGARIYAEDVHPILARFPSRAELQQRIDAIRRDDPPAYEAARQDFDLAIRSRWTLQGPKWPGKPLPTPIVKPELTLSALMPRKAWDDYIHEIDQMDAGDELAQFYRDHLEELCFDDTRELRAVLLDILLNGWDDWSEWDEGKPSAFREKFPYLHRVYAIRELVRLKHGETKGTLLEHLDYSDANRVVLDVFAAPETAPFLITEAHLALADLGKELESLAFVLEFAFSAEDVRVRERLQTGIPGFAQRASEDARCKALWESYVDSDIPVLRFEARKAHGLPVPGAFEQRYAQEAWVAENDPDPERRQKTAHVIRRREILRKRQEGTLTREEWEEWQRQSPNP